MPKMKDSGIEWVGEVPEYWDITPIRYLFTENKVKNTMKQENFALKFTYGTIVPKTNFDVNNDEYAAETISKYTVVKPGMIMINCLNLNYDFVSQRIGLVRDKGVITSAYLCLVPNHLMDSEFATYQLKYWDSVKAFHNMGTGVRKTLKFEELGKKYFPHPPIEEQKAIANTLNQICGTLDNTKSDIKKQIEILQEYKKSIIAEAVTKGLDKNVDLKDSGVEWIGEIPAHWNVIPIRFLFTENKVKNTRKQEKLALKFTYGTIIPKENFDADNDEYVAETISNYTIVKPGMIMINCLNLNYDFVSQRVGLVKDNGAITSAYLSIVPSDELDSEFVTYQLKYWDSVKAFHNMGTGVRKTLNFDELGKKYFPYPSIKEQKEIANYLNNKCSEVDSIVETKKQQIETLEEYKKSIIYEYVTGKRTV